VSWASSRPITIKGESKNITGPPGVNKPVKKKGLGRVMFDRLEQKPQAGKQNLNPRPDPTPEGAGPNLEKSKGNRPNTVLKKRMCAGI